MNQAVDTFLPNEPTRFAPSHLNELLNFTTKLDASDVTIQSGAPIFAEIYGRLRKVTRRSVSNTEVGDLINEIYGPNGVAQILSGNDIDTQYEFKPSRTERLRFRVNATGCLIEGHDGIQITLRTVPTTPPSIDDLNLEEGIINSMAPEEGIVYVTGATGSGKSTLLASIIRRIIEDKESHRKVLTYESPIEFVYDEVQTESALVSQSEIPRHIGSFALGVRNALRRKPRLILVGESRDAETISASLEAALTGHPVYTTLHTTGVAETLRRLVTTYPSDERHGRTIDILETIRLCIWQKLVPSTDGQRIALREFLVFDENIRDRLLAVHPEKVTAATRKLVEEFGQTMTQVATKAFEEGKIAEREFKVLTAQGQDLS